MNVPLTPIRFLRYAGEQFAGVHATSPDGLKWTFADPPLAYSKRMRWDDGTGFSASIRLGSRSVRLGLAVPGPIAAGGTGRLVATVPSGIRRAVRKAKPKSIAHFGVTAVSDSKGRVQRPEMKVKVR